MNFLSILFRVGIGFLTFVIGMGVAGGPNNAVSSKERVIQQTRANALNAKIEAMNAYSKLIEADRKQVDIEAARAASDAAIKIKNLTEETDEKSIFAPAGDFEIILGNVGVFKNVTGIYIVSSEYDEDERLLKPVVPRGGITVASSDFEIENILVSPDRVAFTTKSKNGVSYKFAGRASKRSNEYGHSLGVISGILSKYKNGNKIAHGIVEFEEFEGC